MACNKPVKCWQGKNTSKLVFDIKAAYNPAAEQFVPCGRCNGCRKQYAQEWSVRMMKEASLWSANCSITLTYNDKHLPANATLVPKHFQDFLKRLRRRASGVDKVWTVDRYGERYTKPIRFYHCGEYGEKNFRPHYHAALFNYDFPDRVFLRNSRLGFPLYESAFLSDVWGKGDALVNDLTPANAAYIALYMLKKGKGNRKGLAGADFDLLSRLAIDMWNHFDGDESKFDDWSDKLMDRWEWRHPEYATMSNRPAIGKLWLEKYMSDVYPRDGVLKDDYMVKPPRFFDKVLREKDFSMFLDVKERRLARLEGKPVLTQKRLDIKDKYLALKQSNLDRSL